MDELRRLDLRGQRAEDVDLASTLEHVRGGGIVAHPTETVYGFGCLLQREPLRRLRVLKSRPEGQPFLVLVPDRASTSGLAWTDEAEELASVFWPGALTLVLSDPDGLYPPEVRAVAGSVAVRVSSHPLTARLVRELAAPLTSTSVNRPGEPPARHGEEAAKVASEVGAGPETVLLDVGELPPSAVSTIVDCTGEAPRVVRQGSITIQRMRCVLPEIHGAPPG